MASFGSQGTPSRSSPCAKGKDKAGNQARARQRLQLEERASWTPALTETFLQCCADDIDNFGRVSTSLEKAAWLRVVADFNKRTNSNLQITQLKNRWDQLKREWVAWRMLNDDRSVTGIGWNPAKKTVTGPDHWWATMILRNKLAAKFKDAGLEHADLMERVFRDVTATGAGAYVPRSRQERMAEVESDNSHDLHSDGTNAVHSPEQFGPAVAKRLKSDSVARGSGTQSDLHIEAIKKLSSLPIFKDENNHECQELHWWAIRLFEKAGKVDAFLGFNSDVGRQTWLYYEHCAALNTYERGHSRDEAIPPPYFPPPPYDLL
ncbi:hypothetical protein Vadar_011364 [Vaccinium darrowii]|uniref:Uncharacterized protein n=1 Tax=Vaccinium darrowii TaxID=229202 RepID=A0ACB7Z3D7_9ERIC|nr:hypothetical protein Vadar_011364 [Vaccinium darrowii]